MVSDVEGLQPSLCGSTNDAVIDVTDLNFDGSFEVGVSDPHLRSAVLATMSEAGLNATASPSEHTLHLTDDVSLRGHNIVTIVDDVPGTCQQILEALLARQVAGVVSRAEIAQLPLVVSAVVGAVATLPVRVLEASGRLPALEERQRKVLQLLACGLSNTSIANSLHVSQATVKREVSELLRLFGASNRLELVMRGSQVGLVDASKISLSSESQT